MKLKYQAKKLSRINSRFTGVDCDQVEMLWYPNEHKWKEMDNSVPWQSWCDCKSTKAFIRRLKEWSKYLPKGTIFVLKSRWIGYDIIGKTK